MNVVIILAAVMLAITGCRSVVQKPQETIAVIESRPAAWAVPVTVPGVSNMYKVSDTLYRSAQPAKEGFSELERLGIKTVLCLRTGWSNIDVSKDSMLKTRYVQMRAWSIRDEDIIAALRILTSPSSGPCLVHCYHGSDRTGVVCAAYRIVVQNWSKEDAIAELVNGGYGYHTVFGNILEYLRGMDVEVIRKAVKQPEG